MKTAFIGSQVMSRGAAVVTALALILSFVPAFPSVAEASTVTLFPNGIGIYDDWDVSPGSGSVAKVSAVSTDNGDTSYIDETANNKKR